MPQLRDWPSFLSDNENKTGLIKFIADYCKTEKNRYMLKIPLTITAGSSEWLITRNQVLQLPSCNHHEADTRIIHHAMQSTLPTVVVASDTDIFILLLYAIQQQKESGEPKNVHMRIDAGRYVNVRAVANGLPDDVLKNLPAYHSITGCDTTSYPFKVGKVKPLKNMNEE